MDSKALSLGVSESSPWDLEMAERGYEVIEYDASIEKCPYNHKNIIFHKKFIGIENNENTITLEQAIRENKISENKENILQCDIENAEWGMLEGIDIELLSKNFTQVIFEFHGCNPEEQEGVELRTRQLARLKEYFVPIHTHLNNHGKIFYSQGLFWSTTIEVSYLRKDIATKFLQNGYRKIAGNIEGLDYPSFASNPEIPLRFERIE
ncbi:FkbM family methyltransferase [Helicobacter burdigaliensis]|uniref:FkbM family methyltransferase n=1 Tax=Helicobacter burdigaliensis TaxID=2315334 RepID=UPI001E2E26E2|nr:FkbM family methyltransferase [Helicobacter burdigaliensis]